MPHTLLTEGQRPVGVQHPQGVPLSGGEPPRDGTRTDGLQGRLVLEAGGQAGGGHIEEGRDQRPEAILRSGDHSMEEGEQEESGEIHHQSCQILCGELDHKLIEHTDSLKFAQLLIH